MRYGKGNKSCSGKILKQGLQNIQRIIISTMNKHLRSFFILLFILLFAYFFLPQKADQKKIYLYAWERPQDFSFLAENDYYIKNVGVAYLAGEITSKNGKLAFHNRRNPLIIPEDIEVISVVRINPLNTLEELTDNKEEIARFITDHCFRAGQCQLDMDTRPSEYSSYGEIIGIVNDNLGYRVSISALASWCNKKSWMNDLKISYAVPMLYRMGESSFLLKAENIILDNNFCKKNVALSTDELDFDFQRYVVNKNVFVFNPDTWTKESLDDIIKVIYE